MNIRISEFSSHYDRGDGGVVKGRPGLRGNKFLVPFMGDVWVWLRAASRHDTVGGGRGSIVEKGCEMHLTLNNHGMQCFA